jgi:hypothetical protein
MKAISLHQPWATLILLGAKTFETRSWQTSHRGTLAIHAAKHKSAEFRQLCVTDPEISAVLAKHGLTYDTLPFGAILGTAQVGEMVQTEHMPSLSFTELACGDYTPGRYAWQLYRVESLVRPVLCRGFQQLWTVAPDYLPMLHTREALASAFTKRYGGLVQADDIRDLMNLTQEDDADTTLHVQASREARTDWYEVRVNESGQLEATSIEQLPF